MSISFQLQNYRITCQLINLSLKIKLQPVNFEDKNLNHYVYEAEYNNQNFPQHLSFAFCQKVTSWFTYIKFFNQKVFGIQMDVLKTNEQSPQVIESQLEDLPMYFIMKMPDGQILSQRLILRGSKKMFSRERKLQKQSQLFQALYLKQKEQKQTLINQCQRLKQQFQLQIQKQKKLTQLGNSTIQELQKQIVKLNKQIQRLKIQELPGRKMVHLNQDIELIQVEKSKQEKKVIMQLSNSSSQSSNKKSQSSIESFPNNHLAYQTANESINLKNMNSTHIEYQKIDNSQKLINLNSLSNQNNSKFNSASFSNPPQTTVKRDTTQQDKKTTKLNLQNQNFSIKNSKLNVNQKDSNYIFSEEKLNMIKKFVSQKCLLEVGFDQKGVKKTGYCCMFCEKVFKQSDFLNKHFLSRHQEINNETTPQNLNLQLASFKKNKQLRISIIEANLDREKKRKELENAINKLTGK